MSSPVKDVKILVIQLSIEVKTVVTLLITCPPFRYFLLNNPNIENSKHHKNITNPIKIVKNKIPLKTYSIQIQLSGATPKNSCIISGNIPITYTSQYYFLVVGTLDLKNLLIKILTKAHKTKLSLKKSYKVKLLANKGKETFFNEFITILNKFNIEPIY